MLDVHEIYTDMLQAKTEEQRRKVADILQDSNSCYVDRYGVEVDDIIDFNEMAEIVDFLREVDENRRRKAREAGNKSGIDGLWVSDAAIYLNRVVKDDAVKFVQSLGAFGYDTDELMDEYEQRGMIMI